jgi:Phosphotransferase enzyme family
MSTEPEESLAGGWVNQVVKIGDTVHRSTGAWTHAIHALLRHLEARGFDAAPRVLGFDEQGREVLTYIDGECPDEPWVPELRTDEGLRAVTRLLRNYHDAIADFVPPPDIVWRIGAVPLNPGEIVQHGDFAPWNIVWRAGRPVAVIDWDFAMPGTALFEVANLAWTAVPLRGEDRLAAVGFTAKPDLRARLRLISETYGSFTPTEIVDAVFEVGRTDNERTLERAGLGLHPWVRFLENGDPERTAAEMAWLAEYRASLV